MPNKGGKKKGKRNNDSTLAPKRALIYKEELEEYAQVSNCCDRRLMVTLLDKSETLAIIPGRFRKRCWIKVGDVIIVSRREFEIGKMDVIYKYNDDEIRKLIRDKEIPDYFTDALANNNSDNEEVDFDWDEDADKDEEDIFELKTDYISDIGKDINIDDI